MTTPTPPPLSDAELWSRVDRDAPGLDDYVARHPEAQEKVAAWRAARRAVREVALPERIGGCRILRLLGRGGMGVVYEAEQELPRRRVALKVVPGALLPAGFARFERECAALGRLDHPGVARIHAAGRTAEGAPFLVMELVRGPILDERRRDPAWTLRARLEFFERLGDAVAAAHAAGIVHRDLKPGNVLVDEEGRPKVVDFGLALLSEGPGAGRVTRAGGAVGTFAYASPEQLRGGDVNARTDVFALGVMLYELLTGVHPFAPTESSVATVVSALAGNEPPPPPSRLVRSLARDLDAIALTALERDPARRYADAGALARDLRRFLDHRPIVARPPGLARRAALFARRRRVLLLVVAVALAAAAAAWVARPGPPPLDLTTPLAGDGYLKRSPYPRLRWRGATPEVWVNGRFLELVAIDGLRTDLLLAYCRQTAGRVWVKRFSEDLPQVLERMTGRPAPDAVTLRLRDPATGAELERAGVPMTPEHRRSLWSERHATPFDEVAVAADRVTVVVRGVAYELLVVSGVPVERLRALAQVQLGAHWQEFFARGLVDLVEIDLDAPAEIPPPLTLRRLADGAVVEITDAELRPQPARE